MDTFFRLVIAAILLLTALYVLLPLVHGMVQTRFRSARTAPEARAASALRASFGAGDLPHIAGAVPIPQPAPLHPPRFRERPTLWWVRALAEVYADLRASAPARTPRAVDRTGGGAARVVADDTGAGHARTLVANRGLRWYALVAANLGCFIAGFALHAAVGVHFSGVPAADTSVSRPTSVPPQTVSVHSRQIGPARQAQSDASAQPPLAITASHLRIDRNTAGLSLPPGSVFIDLHVALTNTTLRSEPYAFESFSLRAFPSGKVYEPRFNPNLLNTQLLDDTLSAGQSVQGDISFVVAQRETAFRLFYHGARQSHGVPVHIQ